MTPRFLTPLRLEKVGDRKWILLDHLVYESAILGRVVVPKGFITDLASVPRLPFAYWLTGGRGDAAAVVHDWLYQTQRHKHGAVSRSTADAVFYEAIGAPGPNGAPGEPGWARTLMWLGVRVGGWRAWARRDARVEALNVEGEAP